MKLNIIYGTAWKKEGTSSLVSKAIEKGYRAIDTACQPKHYNEKGAGEGILKSGIDRKDIFIQTKFTPVRGQDPETIPYDPRASISHQIQTSFQVSQENLKTEYIDSLILHSPFPLLIETLAAWEVMEGFVESGKVGRIGISNCYDFEYFKALYETSKVKPSFLQNRFYQDSGYDKELRSFCQENAVTYQSFWTLTANPHILESNEVKEVAFKYKLSPAQVMFNVLSRNGILPLTGTTSEEHMEMDLATFNTQLSDEDVESVSKLFS